jgi:hypothetical protein
MSIASTASPFSHTRHKLAALAAALAGPLAWFVHLVAGYALTSWECAGHGRLVLHLLSIVCLLATAAGCRLAWIQWGEFGREWPSSSEEAVVGRIRLMGVIGVLAGLLFAWIICTQWIAIAFLDPCPP